MNILRIEVNKVLRTIEVQIIEGIDQSKAVLLAKI